MSENGVLNLALRDVYGDSLRTHVDLFFRNQTLAHDPAVHEVDATKTIKVNGLKRFPNGLYRLEVDAASYQTVSQFVNIGPSGMTELAVTLPVNPSRVTGVDFSPYKQLPSDVQGVLESSKSVLRFEKKIGKELYGALDDIRRAGFLNLTAKANRTRLENDKTVLSYIGPLNEIRGDRFLASIQSELISETEHSVHNDIFHPVDETLHQPPPGFEHAGSYKTMDHYGNLQLTFFSAPNKRYALDMDIDDAQGLEHGFQVIKNFATRQPTHPFNIHEILLEFQKLDPGYKLKVREDSDGVTTKRRDVARKR